MIECQEKERATSKRNRPSSQLIRRVSSFFSHRISDSSSSSSSSSIMKRRSGLGGNVNSSPTTTTAAAPVLNESKEEVVDMEVEMDTPVCDTITNGKAMGDLPTINCPTVITTGGDAVAGTGAAASFQFPSTSQPCTHHSPKEDHVPLPHHEQEFWRPTMERLAPLASYYVEYILSAKRNNHTTPSQTQTTETPTRTTRSSTKANTATQSTSSITHAPASSATTPTNPTTPLTDASTAAATDRCIWRQHYPPAGTPPPPVYPTPTCIAFLRTLRHPSIEEKFSGKSLTLTLDEVLESTDRAHFFQVLLPFLAHLVLQLPTLFPTKTTCLPKLIRGVDASVTLSAHQCACLFACQFFSLFTSQGYRTSTWPTCNFDQLFSVMRSPMSGKHMLILNYVARIENPLEGIPHRFITFHRRVLSESACAIIEDSNQLSANSTPLTPVEFHVTGSIEDANHSLQADFANMYIGGGVLYTGCVQEEIRFCLSPECLISMILCESMVENETIQIIGPGMYSHYAGYGTDLAFGSDLPDEGLELDEFGRKSNCLVAIDAIDFCHNNGGDTKISPHTQWEIPSMQRETLKAFIGFSYEQQYLGQKFAYDSVATGNWGCGAFGGFVPLKFLLQWLACSLAHRRMKYYSFGNPLGQSIPKFIQLIESASAASTTSSASSSSSSSSGSPVTVGQLWSILTRLSVTYSQMKLSDLSHDRLFADIINRLQQERNKTANNHIKTP